MDQRRAFCFLARCLGWIRDGYPCSSWYTDEPSTPHPTSHFHTGLSVSVHCKAMDRARKILNAVGISTTSLFNKGTSMFKGQTIGADNLTVFFPAFDGMQLLVGSFFEEALSNFLSSAMLYSLPRLSHVVVISYVSGTCPSTVSPNYAFHCSLLHVVLWSFSKPWEATTSTP